MYRMNNRLSCTYQFSWCIILWFATIALIGIMFLLLFVCRATTGQFNCLLCVSRFFLSDFDIYIHKACFASPLSNCLHIYCIGFDHESRVTRLTDLTCAWIGVKPVVEGQILELWICKILHVALGNAIDEHESAGEKIEICAAF